jgi:hypothetical protein
MACHHFPGFQQFLNRQTAAQLEKQKTLKSLLKRRKSRPLWHFGAETRTKRNIIYRFSIRVRN